MNSALACALLCTLRPLKWSVTPEVAGSSPVAPVENILQNGIFVAWLGTIDRRLPARPALIPQQVEKSLFAGLFAPAGGTRGHPPARISPGLPESGQNGRSRCREWRRVERRALSSPERLAGDIDAALRDAVEQARRGVSAPSSCRLELTLLRVLERLSA
jgi:hypothetical protein